jgi:hypothetical protein
VRAPKGEVTKYSINERQHLDKRALLLSVAKVAKVLASHRIAKVDGQLERARKRHALQAPVAAHGLPGTLTLHDVDYT